MRAIKYLRATNHSVHLSVREYTRIDALHMHRRKMSVDRYLSSCQGLDNCLSRGTGLSRQDVPCPRVG